MVRPVSCDDEAIAVLAPSASSTRCHGVRGCVVRGYPPYYSAASKEDKIERYPYMQTTKVSTREATKYPPAMSWETATVRAAWPLQRYRRVRTCALRVPLLLGDGSICNSEG